MEFSNNNQNLSFVQNNLVQGGASNSNVLEPEERRLVEWSWEENKIFENTLAEFGFESEVLLPTLAMRIPTKSISQFNQHFQDLLDDVRMIESDLIPIPKYGDDEEEEEDQSTEVEISDPGRKRRRGVPWTKREHELFVEGLEKYGKGDWKSISRHMVKTKTATQVASHAQKYFLKLQKPSSHRRGGPVMRTVEDLPSKQGALVDAAASGDLLTSSAP